MRYLDSSWENVTEIVIYGFGKQGKGLITYLSKQFTVRAIIDNGIRNINFYNQIPIMTYEKYYESDSKKKIIIAASGKANISIKRSLEEDGKIEYIDFIDAVEFITVWNWQFKNKVYLGRLTTSITEKCSLRCKYCITYMPYFKVPVNYSLEEICEEFELFFTLVDSVASLYIMGGEPFLHPDLEKIVRYVSENFSKKIEGEIVLVTNGTVIPEVDTIKTFRELGIKIRISDYSRTIPYEKRIEKLINIFDQFRVDYDREIFNEWIDMGRPDENIRIGDSPEEIKIHMKKCNVACAFLCKMRYYYCNREWAAEIAFDYADTEGDYLDLRQLTGDIQKGREKIVDFYLGNLEQGYCKFCQRCRGFESDLVVKAAEQL